MTRKGTNIVIASIVGLFIAFIVCTGYWIHKKLSSTSLNDQITYILHPERAGIPSAVTEFYLFNVHINEKELRSFELTGEFGQALAIGLGEYQRTNDERAFNNNMVRILERLVQSGFDVNAYSNNGTTPLHDVAISAKPSAVKWLVQHGADVSAKVQKPTGNLIGYGNHTGKTIIQMVRSFADKWPDKDYTETIKVLSEYMAEKEGKDGN